MNSSPVGSVRRMISAALLSRSGRSETVTWPVCCPVNIASTEGLFDSFLRRAILPILGRSRKALFPYRESYKSDETPLSSAVTFPDGRSLSLDDHGLNGIRSCLLFAVPKSVRAKCVQGHPRII